MTEERSMDPRKDLGLQVPHTPFISRPGSAELVNVICFTKKQLMVKLLASVLRPCNSVFCEAKLYPCYNCPPGILLAT